MRKFSPFNLGLSKMMEFVESIPNFICLKSVPKIMEVLPKMLIKLFACFKHVCKCRSVITSVVTREFETKTDILLNC